MSAKRNYYGELKRFRGYRGPLKQKTNEEKWIEYRRSVGLPDQSPEIEDGWDEEHNCSNRVARLIYMNDSDTYGD